MTDKTKPESFAADVQGDIYLQGLGGRQPVVPIDFNALEDEAREAMSPEAFAYIAGGAGAEDTMAANRAAFERWRIVPRMLRDVSQRDTGIELLGHKLDSPFLVCPIGVLEMAHRDADLAVARAAAEHGIPYIFSNQASRPMEDCAAVMGDAPHWFQLYWSTSNELVASFARRAEACGCQAIVITLDTTLLGWRTRDLDLAYLPFLRGKGIAQYTSDPVFMDSLETAPPPQPPGRPPLSMDLLKSLAELGRVNPQGWRGLRSGKALAAVRQFINIYSRPSLTWTDLPFLREHTKLPILLKGILHPDDARRAVDEGIDGLVVSNHGGRQVDGAIATLEALPAIAEAVDGRVPIILDSGIRSGADAFKALALGATAIGIGRPHCYGLAAGGQSGVSVVLRNFRADFELNMALAGCRSISEISRENLQEGFSLPW